MSRGIPDFWIEILVYRYCVGSTPSILVIDRNSEDVLALRRAFANTGVINPLNCIGNSREALQYLDGTGAYFDRMRYPIPSVILLDLDEPSGFELLTWIRDKFPSGGLLIVALTRLEEIRKLSRAYSLGANSFLTKPINNADVQELINIFGGYWLIHSLHFGETGSFATFGNLAYDS